MSAPYSYSQSRQIFAHTLGRDSATRVIRVGVLGDSTADPINLGHPLIEALNFVAATRLTGGIIGETPPLRPSSNDGPLYTGNAQGTVATRIASDKVLPGFAPISMKQGALGVAWTLHDKGESSANPDNVGPQWFNIGTDLSTASVGLQLFAATNASSGELLWYSNPLVNLIEGPYTGGTYGANGTFPSNGTTALGLESATFAVKSVDVSLLMRNGFPKANTIITPTDAVKYTDLVGGIFKSTVNTRGLVFHGLGIGGYTSASFLNSHSNAQAMAVALDYRAIWHRFGINDDGNAIPATTWKANTIANIAWWDAAYSGTRQLLHIVDPGCAASSDTGLRDAYATAAYEIAQTDPDVMSLNLYQIGLNAGWDSAGATRYTLDGVHPNAYGSRFTAVNALSLMIDPDPPPARFLTAQQHATVSGG